MLKAEQGSGGRGEAEAPARRPCVPSPHLCPVSLQITHGRPLCFQVLTALQKDSRDVEKGSPSLRH